MKQKFQQAYDAARGRYAQVGVDTDAALKALGELSLSLPCWQGDDVTGFESCTHGLSGGIQVTGGRPGRAHNPEELRADLSMVLSLIPGKHRVNLHAMYGEFGKSSVDHDGLEPVHFQGWTDWAAGRGIGLDFNATLFSHPLADSGFTLSSKDEGVRSFWQKHVRRARAVGAHLGSALGTPCVHNLWIPDGAKDTCVDRAGHRALLKESLDAIYSTRHDPEHLKDAVECKLFGIGSEAFVVGSHEFYLAYAVKNGLILCLDLGHFHPTESVSDKISSLQLFTGEILLHLSRGVHWDSDHVVALDDAVREVAHEIVRSGMLHRVHVALDFFDASVNRVGALVTGARAGQKAFLLALLEPTEKLLGFEETGNGFARLAWLEAMKVFPFGAVWDWFCHTADVPVGGAWIDEVVSYEKRILETREP